MLYDLVAEHFGVDNDHNLQAAVDSSGVSVLDCMDDAGNVSLPAEVVPKLLDALNAQTDRMIEAELASGANKIPLEEMLFQLSQMPGIRVTGLPNRKSRRAAKNKA